MVESTIRYNNVITQIYTKTLNFNTVIKSGFTVYIFCFCCQLQEASAAGTFRIE